jgi:hypothetical protein
MTAIAMDALENGWRFGITTGRMPHVQEDEMYVRLDERAAGEAEDLVAKLALNTAQDALLSTLADLIDFIFKATNRYATR